MAARGDDTPARKAAEGLTRARFKLPDEWRLLWRVGLTTHHKVSKNQFLVVCFGSGGRIRTYDQLINSQLLYH